MRKRVVNTSIEDKILTGLIVSDKVCRDVYKMIRKNSFLNPYIQTISKWIIDYYKKYHKAPKQQIQDIYNVEKEKIKEEEHPLISSFLSRISESFEKEESLNEDYLIDISIEYLKKTAMKNIIAKVDSCLEVGKVSDAEKELFSYKQVTRDSGKFINPFSEDAIKKFFEDEANESNRLFSMDGALGNLIGTFERGTLVGIMAPAKRGKSFWLMEVAIRAFFERKKVLFVSLEMPQFKMERRILKRIVSRGNESKDFVFPCFDCYKNQMNICRKSVRVGRGKLRDASGNKPEVFDRGINYTVCDVCRGTNDFQVDTWFTLIRKQRKTLANTKKLGQGLMQMYSDNFRLVCYPKFSANVSDIKSDIDILEADEDWIPDVIVVDYADILAPEDSRVIGRDRYDETWKMFGNLADIRRALVVTASQTNRQSFNKKNVTQIDAAEDIRKIANVDVMISLNQTPQEKRQGVMRVAVVAGRDDDFDQYRTCLVLQNLELAQVCLDSELSPLFSKPMQGVDNEAE